jgi:hypothetical protein
VAESAEDDSPAIDHEAGIPAGLADAHPYVAEPVVEAADGDVGARVRADAGGAFAETFDRESE